MFRDVTTKDLNNPKTKKRLKKMGLVAATVASRGMLLPLLEMPSSAGYPEDLPDKKYTNLKRMSKAELRKLAAKKKNKK